MITSPAADAGYSVHCDCCGAQAVTFINRMNGRCSAHQGRNPCAIDGCTRTTSVGKDGAHSDWRWICGEHWRRFVPPRSLRRRAYLAFFRKAKRYGWTDELNQQFWSFWFQLVRTARHHARNDVIDEAEIARMFGWDTAA